MENDVVKGEFDCKACGKNQTWFYQETRRDKWGTRISKVFIVYEPKENESRVYQMSDDRKTGYVNCCNRRCDHLNMVDLKDTI